ncbi:MAG: GrpB family protein [Patescibacteria group bacterium]|jgi:GrpB-like predicted nucleotidyltransferase (UPF0157 family)
MLTPSQTEWINHLSDINPVTVVPFDPACETKFQIVKDEIQKVLGKDIEVLHRGASSLGISGQDEIDTYVPVPPAEYEETVDKLKSIFGEPRSHYPLKRTRFVTLVEGKHIDIFVMNQEDDGWKNGVRFHDYLLSHPQALDDYRRLKEGASGQSTREYYRRKIEFINGILEKI